MPISFTKIPTIILFLKKSVTGMRVPTQVPVLIVRVTVWLKRLDNLALSLGQLVTVRAQTSLRWQRTTVYPALELATLVILQLVISML